VVVCAAKDEDAGGLVTWLNAQDVHAFVVRVDGPAAADVSGAVREIRAHVAEWQVRAGAVGVLGTGERGAEAVKTVIGDADFAVVLGAEATGFPKAKRKDVFVGPPGGFEKALGAWLERFKGTVF
jgi:hypothetical protein